MVSQKVSFQVEFTKLDFNVEQKLELSISNSVYTG